MKWLNDKDSVSQEELVENRKSADAAYAAYALAAAAACAARAAYAAYADADAEKWVNKYFDGTKESKQDYIDALESERPEIKPEVWVDGLPPVGTSCEAKWIGSSTWKLIKFKGSYSDDIWFSSGGNQEIVLRSEIEFRPLKTQEEIDREEFIEKGFISYLSSKTDSVDDKALERLLTSMFYRGFTAPKGMNNGN